jgi:glycerol-3-phosphate acyltransferase PlsX
MGLIRIAVDATGGDNAPDIVVDASIDAINADQEIHLTLFGDESTINQRLSGKGYDKSRLEVVHAPEVIENTESPVLAIRRKKDSSIVKGLRSVKEGQCDAFVSAGSTGAVLAGGTLIVGRIKGIERPALGSFLPTRQGVILLMDCGANVDSKPEFLHQFATMGSVYYQSFVGVEQPTIGLMNVGDEDEKGNKLTKDTFKLIEADQHLNFVGNVEGRDFMKGDANVLVADGFVGNIVLKHSEGLSSELMKMIKDGMTSTWYAKIGALLVKGPLKKMMKKFDYREYGGAPLLGLEGLVVKAHGSSDAYAFKNAILQCKTFSKEKVNDKIKQHLIQ